MYHVYILQSESSGRFYVGHCEDLISRFHQHRSGHNKSTCSRGPWWMPYYETYSSRSEAMARERAIKAKKSASSIRRIIQREFPALSLK